ncbi:MAG TPA: protein kinase [Arthrobacter sp.]
MTSTPTAPAELIGGRYALGELIGRGGMASVYAARDLNLGRDVAMKLFAPQYADAEELRRQESETGLLATLKHPSLVTLYDSGTDTRVLSDPRPFLTMELVAGKDLRARIRRGPMPLDELAVIGAGVADALAYMHSLGIIHRDIKPANILLERSRAGEPLRPKLTDFGLARSLDASRLTSTGMMLGTAAYLSPEQAMGVDLGPASDIFSLGLVLLECLKGELEYPGSAVESAVARLQRSPVVPDHVPAEWTHLLQSMTAMDPLLRPGGPEVAAALRQALASSASLPGEIAGRRALTPDSAAARPPRSRRVGGRAWTALLLSVAALFSMAPAVPAAAPEPVVVATYPATAGTVEYLPEPTPSTEATPLTVGPEVAEERPANVATPAVKSPVPPAVSSAPVAPPPVLAPAVQSPPVLAPAVQSPAVQAPLAVPVPVPAPSDNGKGLGRLKGNGKNKG